MFGKRQKPLSLHSIEVRWPTNPNAAKYMLAYGASPATVDLIVERLDRERGLIPPAPGDKRMACNTCGLVRHASDRGECRRCHGCSFSWKARFRVIPVEEAFVDIPPSKLGEKMKTRPKRLTYCARCHGVQPWNRSRCNRCDGKVHVYYGKDPAAKLELCLSRANGTVQEQAQRLFRQENSIREMAEEIDSLQRPTFGGNMADMVIQGRNGSRGSIVDFKCGDRKLNEAIARRTRDFYLGVEHGKKSIEDEERAAYQVDRERDQKEAKISLLEREVADLKHAAHIRNMDMREFMHRKDKNIQRVKDNAGRMGERKVERLKRENGKLQRELDVLQRRPAGVEYFMGRPVSETVDALYLADELVNQVFRGCTHSPRDVAVIRKANAYHAKRNPTGSKSSKGIKLTCPQCGGRARKTGDHVGVASFFCPRQECAWEGEA